MSLTEIDKFVNRKVEIIDTDNVKHTGYIYGYTTAVNNVENEWSLDILPTLNSNDGITLFESEIKSIKAIETEKEKSAKLIDWENVDTIYED